MILAFHPDYPAQYAVDQPSRQIAAAASNAAANRI
jgi:hypothetical protein